ncbi:hypothetical protein NMY22_g13786 [Coprinellus aureogranulatus]|nr:hypothetical protein NMY22_g13786 [Coprinellus aureogranulatus]
MSYLPTEFTDDDVHALSNRISDGGNRGLFKTVLACFMGSSCTEPHIVNVPLRPGLGARPTNIDVFTEPYLETEEDGISNVRDLSNCGYKVSSYPRQIARRTRYEWSIFQAEKKIVRRAALPPNRFIQGLAPMAESGATCSGNVLVVKTAVDGSLLDVLERDLTYIEELVHAYLRDGEGTCGNTSSLSPWLSFIVAMDLGPGSILLHTDIVPIIVAFMSWPALMIFRILPGAAQLVEDEVWDRIVLYLSRYMHEDTVGEFIGLLRSANGVVAGSVVRQILTHMLRGSPSIVPFDLNILVKEDRQWQIIEFFTAKQGYMHRRAYPSRRYREAATGLEILEKPSSSGPPSKVIISITRKGAMKLLLASPTTAQLNILTPNSIITLFPLLTMKNECLQMDRKLPDPIPAEPVDRVPSDGVRLFHTNAHWARDCGSYCPARWRTTYTDGDTLKRYRWSKIALCTENGWDVARNWDLGDWSSPDTDVDQSDIMYQEMIQWRVSASCSNGNCSHAWLRAVIQTSCSRPPATESERPTNKSYGRESHLQQVDAPTAHEAMELKRSVGSGPTQRAAVDPRHFALLFLLFLFLLLILRPSGDDRWTTERHNDLVLDFTSASASASA